MDGNSLQVAIEMGDNAVMWIDRDQFDYLYGENNAPDPVQRDLDQLLLKVTRIRAIASGMFRGQAMGSEAVLDTSDAQALMDFTKRSRLSKTLGLSATAVVWEAPRLNFFQAGNSLQRSACNMAKRSAGSSRSMTPNSVSGRN